MVQRDIKGIASMFWVHIGQLGNQKLKQIFKSIKALTKAMIFVLEKALIFLVYLGIIKTMAKNSKTVIPTFCPNNSQQPLLLPNTPCSLLLTVGVSNS